MNHSISLEKAISMTTLYESEKENILNPLERGKNILAKCETFDATVFAKLLQNPACKKIRIYYGMDDLKKVHAIIVGVDINDMDILPKAADKSLGSAEVLTDEIFEEAIRCPLNCPPVSPLNP